MEEGVDEIFRGMTSLDFPTTGVSNICVGRLHNFPALLHKLSLISLHFKVLQLHSVAA